MLKYIAAIIFLLFSGVYYFYSFGSGEFSQIFMTISTFLFAIFAGFFIARQGKRYSIIRDIITSFDGEMSSIYRHAGHFGVEWQNRIGEVITDHYQKTLGHNAWDFHFVRKSTTITSLHSLAEEMTVEKSLNSLQHLSLQRILTSLENLQVTRKRMVALHKERIPRFQWVLVYFLAVILLISVSTIPSETYFLGSILKGAFSSSVIFVLILLNEFDQLRFFERTIGEYSAKDVIDIISGKK